MTPVSRTSKSKPHAVTVRIRRRQPSSGVAASACIEFLIGNVAKPLSHTVGPVQLRSLAVEFATSSCNEYRFGHLASFINRPARDASFSEYRLNSCRTAERFGFRCRAGPLTAKNQDYRSSNIQATTASDRAWREVRCSGSTPFETGCSCVRDNSTAWLQSG